MTRQEMTRQARQTVGQRRQWAEAEAEQRRAQLYVAEPRLAALAGRQSAAGAAAALLAADGNMDAARAKLDEVQAAAKEQRTLLAALGEKPDALLPRYHCRICSDTGIANGATCACVLEEMKRLRRSNVNASGPLTLCRFENFSVERYPQRMEGSAISPRKAMQAILDDCRDWAAEFGRKSPSLFMYGDAGLGKTHLALSIASEVLEAGFDVIYVSAQNAFATVSTQRGEGDALLRSMIEADLLVMDDLGTEYLDAYTRSRLYELVNTRMHRRPTIYTTNICKQELLNQRYDEKIASRLLGDCHLMRFWGNDLRLERT